MLFLGKLVKAAIVAFVVLVKLVTTAPTERGALKTAGPQSPEGPLKTDEFLKLWFQGRAEDRTTRSGLGSDHKQRLDHHRPGSHHRPSSGPVLDHRPSSGPGLDHRPSSGPGLDHRPSSGPGLDRRPSSGPGLDHRPSPSSRREQMLEMISALEGVHSRSMSSRPSSSSSSRLTLMTRASGRHPGKKHKLLVLRATTAPPGVSNSTVSRPHTVTTTGRSVKKSVSPLHRKPNKRVCFWKYCSQN